MARIAWLAVMFIAVASCGGGEARPDPTALTAAAFEDWRAGRGSPFDLLAEDAEWTIEGRGRFAGTFSRDELFAEIVTPFGASLATPLKPDAPLLYRDGDTVIAVFGAAATLKSGEAYENRYAWFMTFDGNEIVHVRAFLDLDAFERAFPQTL